MTIQFSDHFTYGKLIKFTLPSVIMMIFTSIYGVVDGIFVSNFVGKTPFAAINLIWPVAMILGAVGFMIGTGGCALVSKIMGEGDKEKANEVFSMLIYVSMVIGIVLAILGFVFMRPIAILLGAEGDMVDDAAMYGRVLSVALPFFLLQNEFQSFLVAAEKPKLGLFITVAAGITNIVFDALLIMVFHKGLVGAAWATAISQIVGGIIPLMYFIFSQKSVLKLGKCSFDSRAFIKTCVNGSSEMMTNISMSLVSMLYNFQLLKLAGENGVAAYGVIMYVNFIFVAAFIGYSVGSAPIVSFNYGAGNTDELKSLFKKSMMIILVSGILMTILGFALASPLSHIFVGYDNELLEMTKRGFYIYTLSFLIAGFNIYGSAFFTALNDGVVSAIISFLRTLLFQVVAVLVLPLFFKLDGIWYAVIMAEMLALMVTVGFLITKRRKYRY
ncbi:MAG: MATE family efflux transporter [Lachnospiraceae bacterium]|nr:MATE family efflux transporter [Lachnospiraceae bacterium]